MYICIYIYIYIYTPTYCVCWPTNSLVVNPQSESAQRSISEISSCLFGPRPWHIEIRHRVKKTSTINLFGFETLELKIRRLKLWKPTVVRCNMSAPTTHSRQTEMASGKLGHKTMLALQCYLVLIFTYKIQIMETDRTENTGPGDSGSRRLRHYYYYYYYY